MSRKTLILKPNTENKLKKLGQRIKKARLRRNISAEIISQQAGIGESTFYAIERGASTVSIGAYAAVLFVLGLDGDLDAIAMDEAGKALFWEQNLVERKRAKRRTADKKLPVPNGITEKYEEFRAWDGGYSLGEKEIFNPGSVIEHLGKEKLS